MHMPAPYESWTVYQKALRLRKIAGQLKRTAPRGLSSDLNNLVRGTSSIVYNLVEGAGRFSKADKLHFTGSPSVPRTNVRLPSLC